MSPFSTESCSCCKQASHGKASPNPWAAAAAQRAGSGCGSMTRLNGAGPALMVHQLQARGPGYGGQPHGSRQTRLQTTHHRRCQRHPAGDPGQRTIAWRIARQGIKSSERLASNAEWLRERTAGLPALESCASALKGTWTSTKHYRVLCCSDHLRALRGEGVLAALNVQAIYFDSCWLLIGLDSKPLRP